MSGSDQDNLTAALSKTVSGPPSAGSGKGASGPPGGGPPNGPPPSEPSTPPPSGGWDSKIIVIIIGGLIVVAAIVSIAMLSKGQQQRTVTTQVNPYLDAPRDAMADLAGFSTRLRQEMKELQDNQRKTDERINDLLKRQESTDRRTAETLERGLTDMQKLIREFQVTRGQSGDAPRTSEGRAAIEPNAVIDPEVQRLTTMASRQEVKNALDDFRDNLLKLNVEPKKARANTFARLRAAGVNEQDVRNLMAAEAQKAGRYFIGDIAEDYPRLDDMAKQVPEVVVRMMPDVVQFMAGLGQQDGKLLPAQAYADVERHVRAKVAFTPNEKTVLKKEIIEKICMLGRVRRENLSDDEQDYIPFLIEKRKQAGIQPEDRVTIAKMVWAVRDQLPQGISAGKLLSFVAIIGREVNNTENSAAKQAAGLTDASIWKSLDQESLATARNATETAIRNGLSLGRTSQADQMDIGMRALKQHLETRRVSSTEEQRSRILLEAMVTVSQEPAKPVPGPAEDRRIPRLDSERQRPIDRPDQPPRGPSDAPVPVRAAAMQFGPLDVSVQNLAVAIFWMTPDVLRVAGLEPDTPGGSAAAVATWEQMQRLADTLSTSPNGLRDISLFRNAIVPQTLNIMRGMRPFSAIDVKMSPDPAVNTTHDALLFRGVVMGSVYGPYLHDEDRAKLVATQALEEIEQTPPFTEPIRARIASISDTRTWERIIAAYQAYRPGRVSYPASRYQDIVAAIPDRMAYAKQIVNALGPVFVDDKEDALGRFMENLRVFIPVSLAIRENGRIPIDQLMALVDRDVRSYAVSYSAEYIAIKQIMTTIVPMYSFSISDEYGGPTALVIAVGREVPLRIANLMRSSSPPTDLPNLVDTSKLIADTVIGDAEGIVAKEVVLSRVLPRLARQGKLAGPQAIADASAYAKVRTDELVKAPYNPARIDGWSAQVTNESVAVMEGKRNPGTDTASNAPGAGKGGANSGLPPSRAILSKTGGSQGGNLIGLSTTQVRSKKVVIPAGSYGNAHIITGASCEIGSSTGQTNIPVLVNLNYDWQGPNGSRLNMRNLRLIGAATPKKGPHRVSIAIKALSYVFPSGRSLYQDVDGYVVDNVEGKEGAIGEWNWNLGTVMPLAIASGSASGISDALRASGTTTVLGAAGVNATTQIPNQDRLQTALYGGVAGGFDVMNGFVTDVLKDVHPSIEVPNGQRVTVVLSKPVVLDVPEEEFNALAAQAAGNGSFSGF